MIASSGGDNAYPTHGESTVAEPCVSNELRAEVPGQAYTAQEQSGTDQGDWELVAEL